jgi:PAS domain-containing protein
MGLDLEWFQSSWGRRPIVCSSDCDGSRTVWKGRPAALGNLIDITERGRAREALRESEELFRRAFEDTNLAMVVTDLDHRFVRPSG